MACVTRRASKIPAHVVDPDHRRARGDPKHGRGDGARGALERRGAQQGAEEPLARRAEHHRPAQRGDPVEVAQQEEVVVERLAETDAGVEQHLLFAHAGGEGVGQAPLEKGDHLADHVVVARGFLHGPRLAQHVHEAHRTAALGDERGHGGVAAQGRDVVHEAGAGVERGPRHRRLGRVDRDESLRRGGEAFDCRHHARAQSSSPAATGSDPGRVDSPPTSMIAAPSAASSRPRATADSVSAYRPPSENESGVTFTMPMTHGRVTGRLVGGKRKTSGAPGRPSGGR